MRAIFEHRRAKRLRTAMVATVALIAFLIGVHPATVAAHPLDEFSQKTRLFFQPDGITLQLELAPGVLVATLLLEELDADADQQISPAEELAFARMVAQALTVQHDNRDVPLQLAAIDCDPFADLIAGIGTIYLTYRAPMVHTASNVPQQHKLFYENRFYDGLTLYSLHLEADPTRGVLIEEAERDEITQALVNVAYTVGSPVAAATAPVATEQPASWQNLEFTSVPVVDDLIKRLRSDVFAPNVVLILFGLATVAGALHAFTPGHGKTLVAAYLIANRGTRWNAIMLGLLVTITHSASIYLLGGLVLSASQFLLPGRVIPIIEFLAGLVIVGLGLWMLISRWYGGVADHAHVVPNLSILNQRSVNVLLDGNAAAAADLLIVASSTPVVQAAIQRAGADDINICSPGCETHDRLPSIKPECLNLTTVKQALQTGAVDGLIVRAGRRQRLVNRMARRMGRVAAVDEPQTLDDAVTVLLEAIRQSDRRGQVHIPQTELSWRSLASMGLAGGMVPCPDALAILLIAVSIGQLVVGLAVVFFFSIGLALTLVIVGLLIVSSGRVVARSPMLDRLSGVMPYAAALFITTIGCWMILQVVGRVI